MRVVCDNNITIYVCCEKGVVGCTESMSFQKM